MKFKLIFSLLLLQTIFAFSQQKKEPKTDFETKFGIMLDAKNYEKVLELFKDFELKKEHSLLENQIF